MFHPTANPLNPDLVAFERLEQNRRELHFLDIRDGETFPLREGPTERPEGFIGLPELSEDREAAVFSGDLDWRPRSEDDRYWFAYVASDGSGHHLFLDALDARGRRTEAAPIRIPVEDNVRAPRWSPNGRHLAFTAGNELYLVQDVGEVLNRGSANRARVVKIEEATVPALFPEWSPAGDNLAYQVERTTRGTRNWAIEVLPVERNTATVAAAPVVITEALYEESEYRPSWSPDGRYVAFYVDRAGVGAEGSQAMDIGIVMPQHDPRSDQIYRGELIQGRSRRIAENVVASEARGPRWTELADPQGEPQLAVVYVPRDETRNNPVMAAGVQRWADMQPLEYVRVELSETWGTINHKYITGTVIPRHIRYVYVAQAGGAETIRYRDVPAPWVDFQGARGSRVRPVVLSALLPGLGQISEGRIGKGLILGAVSLGSGVVGALGMGSMVEAADTATALIAQDPAPDDLTERYQALKSDYDSGRVQLLAAGGVAAVVWLYGIYDSAVGGSSPGSRFSFEFAPAVGLADGSTGLSARLVIKGGLW